MNDPLLNQEEVESLLEDSADTSRILPAESRDSAFDLARGTARVNGWHKQLGLVDDNLGKALSRSLLGLLHQTSDVSIQGVRLQRFGEYLDGLERPTGLHTFSLGGDSASLLVTLSAPLIYSLLESLFGGTGRQKSFRNKGFTSTEQRVSLLVLNTLAEGIAASWHTLGAGELALRNSEDNPLACTAFRASDTVMVRRYSILYESGGGEMQLVMASSMVEALFQREDNNPIASDTIKGADLQQKLREISVQMTGEIRGAQVPLSTLLQLREGDIIPIQSPETVDVRVNGVSKFRAQVGDQDGYAALSIVENGGQSHD